MSIDKPASAFGFAALLAASAGLAQPSHTQLLSLVPPESQIVAGSMASLQEHHRGAFLIFTRANSLDLEDFFSIIGADASHQIYQLIFAASVGVDEDHPEHSLLVTGQFDTNRIQGSRPATRNRYRGLDIIVVHPIDRESAILRDDRMLTIIDSRLAIFGTARSVREEIDRYLEGPTIEGAFASRLGSLHKQDETWCLISSALLEPGVLRTIGRIDPGLGEIQKKPDSILFGIRYGRQIEFEYVLHFSQNSRELSGPVESLVSSANGGQLFVEDDSVPTGSEYRRVVKMSWKKYERWLAELPLH